VLAITSQPQRIGYPLVVELAEGEGGLPKRSWVKLTQIRTLALARFRGKVGSLSAARMASIDEALLDVLGISLRAGGRG
jgi:mRNA interferase MazF